MDIRLDNVYKSFGDKQVLNGFSLTLPEGSRTALMGRSGSGKTTIANILLGLVRPDKGEISIPVRVSAVFQEDRLLESFSPMGNIRFALGNGMPEADIADILYALGLAGQERLPVKGLSGGMKRRVAIARALLAEGELIILDEPFKGLDEATRELTAKEILKRTEGRTMLLITHDRAEAALLKAERIIEL